MVKRNEKQVVTRTVERKIPVKTKAGVKRKQRVRKTSATAPNSGNPFGPVSTIDTAPVSIGNTIRGSTPVVTPYLDGVRVRGRDFFISIDATASTIVDWTLVGASPFVPAAFVASTLKSFSNTYAQYTVMGLAFHYITASPTSDAGSMVMYINKNRASPSLDTGSANFMSVVLSDDHTVLTPTWKNCSALYKSNAYTYNTAIFDGESLNTQAPCELFVFTKTLEANAPGYVLVDYDIMFTQLQVNPKSNLVPASRVKYNQVRLTGIPVVTAVCAFSTASGKLLDGVTNSVTPPGYVLGDVFKVVLDLNDTVFTAGSTATTLFRYNLAVQGGTVNLPIVFTDGMTLYAVYTATDDLIMYVNYTAAIAGTDPILWASTSASVGIPAYLSLVGNVQNVLAQANV